MLMQLVLKKNKKTYVEVTTVENYNTFTCSI